MRSISSIIFIPFIKKIFKFIVKLDEIRKEVKGQQNNNNNNNNNNDHDNNQEDMFNVEVYLKNPVNGRASL